MAWLVLGPYLTTAATWGSMHRSAGASCWRRPSHRQPTLPGDRRPGLVVVALLDRARGARRARGYDPRLVFLVAGLLVVLSSTGGVTLLGVPSRHRCASCARSFRASTRYACSAPSASAATWSPPSSPATDARDHRGAGPPRGDPACRRRRRARAARARAAGVRDLQLRQPDAARRPRVRLDASDLELVTRAVEGPVLDLPARKIFLSANAEALLLSAYHRHRPRPATTPTRRRSRSRSRSARAHAGAERDRGAGSAGLPHRARPPQVRGGTERRAAGRDGPCGGAHRRPAHGAGQLERHRRLSPGAARCGTYDDFAALTPAVPGTPSPSGEITAAPPRATVSFAIGNPRDATFVHPQPFAPSDLVVTWRRSAFGDASTEHVRALLPLAIAGHASSDLDIALRVPQAPRPLRGHARPRERAGPPARAHHDPRRAAGAGREPAAPRRTRSTARPGSGAGCPRERPHVGIAEARRDRAPGVLGAHAPAPRLAERAGTRGIVEQRADRRGERARVARRGRAGRRRRAAPPRRRRRSGSRSPACPRPRLRGTRSRTTRTATGTRGRRPAT